MFETIKDIKRTYYLGTRAALKIYRAHQEFVDLENKLAAKTGVRVSYVELEALWAGLSECTESLIERLEESRPDFKSVVERCTGKSRDEILQSIPAGVNRDNKSVSTAYRCALLNSLPSFEECACVYVNEKSLWTGRKKNFFDEVGIYSKKFFPFIAALAYRGQKIKGDMSESAGIEGDQQCEAAMFAWGALNRRVEENILRVIDYTEDNLYDRMCRERLLNKGEFVRLLFQRYIDLRGAVSYAHLAESLRCRSGHVDWRKIHAPDAPPVWREVSFLLEHLPRERRWIEKMLEY